MYGKFRERHKNQNLKNKIVKDSKTFFCVSFETSERNERLYATEKVENVSRERPKANQHERVREAVTSLLLLCCALAVVRNGYKK